MVWMVLSMAKDIRTPEQRVKDTLDEIKRLAGMGNENLRKM